MIVIPRKLKDIVEQYIMSSDRTRELGGYFFGSESKFTAFIPSPNFSQNPRRNFERTKTGDRFAQEFGVMLGAPIVAEMHTHPSGSVVSGADNRYIQSHNYPYEVVIADQNSTFIWYVVNRSLQEVATIESDEELEKLAFYFAHEMGLTDLGRVFLSNTDTLLATTPLGRAMLSFDVDSYKLYNLVKDHERRYSFPKKTVMARKTGLSPARVKKALTMLEKEGLIPE